MKRSSLALLAAILLLLAGLPAVAQETTGAIQGTVTDSTGAALPGVTVDAVNLNGQRFNTVTESNGSYRFPAVPPGVYTVTATLAGMEPASVKNLEVKLGTSPKVDLKMRLGALTEAITITAEAPLVDVTSNATATSISREKIEQLPRGRDFTDVVKFAPGVTVDPLAGGISVDGSTGLENRYIIDGIDTTDPQIGSSGVPMRAEFFEEVQVKTAGYAAEFGGSTGGVINAVTRTGTNQFRGGILVDYENNSWNEDRPELNRTTAGNSAQLYDLRKDDRVRYDPGLFIGGPILRDRVWFFGTYQPGLQETERTVTFVNGVTDTYKSDTTVNYSTGNVSALLGSKLSLKGGFSRSPYEIEGLLPSRHGRTTVTAQSSYAPLGEKGERDTYSATADWTATSSIVVHGRAGYYRTNAEDVGSPFFDIIHNFSTAGTNPATVFPEIPSNLLRPLGFLSDNLLTGVRAKDIYERTSGALESSWFFSAAGQHALKFGFQTEEIANDVRRGYNADRILYYWNRSYTTTSGQSVRGKYGYFRLLNISTLGQASTNNDAIFIQDSWTVRPNVTLNIGVRAEHERVPNYGEIGPKTAMEFDFSDKIAPRLGFAWDVFNDARWKVYGSYGTYYDVMKYELPRGSFGGDKWVDYFFTLDDFDWTKNNAATCRTGANTISVRPQCPAGAFIEPVDRRHNAADPADPTIDPDLQPMEQWEAQIGADHQLSGNMRIGARYIHKELVRAIEDVGILVPGVGEVYYIANPGFGLTTTLAEVPFPKAIREYDAVELTFERRFSNRWGLNASYTWSRLWGNYTGLASADEQNAFGTAAGGNAARLSPNVSRAYDHIESSFDRMGNVTNGLLPTDRPHQFKAQLQYQLPWDVITAVSQYIGSGTPVSEIARVPIGINFYPYGRGNMGRTPTLTQTDLALAKNFPIARTNFQVKVNILNLFDEDTVIRYWSNRVQQDLPITSAQFFAGGWDYEALVQRLGANGIDPAFGIPDLFQPSRQVRLELKFTF